MKPLVERYDEFIADDDYCVVVGYSSYTIKSAEQLIEKLQTEVTKQKALRARRLKKELWELK